MKKKPSCPDCGNAPVNHHLEWVGAILDKVFDPVSKPADWIWRKIEPMASGPLFNTITPKIMDALVAVRLAAYMDAPNAKTGGRARVMWQEAMRRGIQVREFQLFYAGREAFIAKYNGEKKAFTGLPRPGTIDSPSLYWMDNKKTMREKFGNAGIPVANGGGASSWRGALKLFRTLQKPVILKPESGSRSRHTTTNIMSEDELQKAFDTARQLSPWVIVEEELAGPVIRITLVNKKVFAVMSKEVPSIVGDGKTTVEKLIEKENTNPKRQGPVFHTIAIDEEIKEFLSGQKVSLGSIPKSGEKILLRPPHRSSRGSGGITVDYTDTTHPENMALFRKIAETLDDTLVGVDFIIKDLTKSWRDQPLSGVIECNSMPFIDLHHFPYEGPVRDVAGALWDLTFPLSRKRA